MKFWRKIFVNPTLLPGDIAVNARTSTITTKQKLLILILLKTYISYNNEKILRRTGTWKSIYFILNQLRVSDEF